ncbi:MAG: alcohol dehydrogenase catalytic domain-containing protein [Defluviitaleaceae bacterium]|nr:alcohol dehydrogenase catalytic domain-containing protein [Defluviitaleaceae bacterium]MCL2837098.1 alcohol dehydrogenase catalytic domain-containing protein [Defluviitaleaceae bacterium]
MLAARLYGKNDLRVENIPIPEINNDEILLRVKAATICGTDLRMYSNGAAGADGNSPLVLCHEFAGIIEKTGMRVSGFKQGQRVAVAPNIGCGVCDLCVSGKSHHCGKLTAIGVHMDGGFAEYVKIPAAAVRLGNVTPIADGVSFEAAAGNEALSCVYSAFERYGVNPGETVVIIGAGAIGLMHVKLAKMAGAAKIILNDISADRLAECVSIEPSIIAVKDNLPERVLEETGGAGANVIVTACSAAAAQRCAFELAALDGRVNFFGGLPKNGELVLLNANTIHYRQLSVTGTTRASHSHYRKTLRFIAAGLVSVDALITHRYALSDIHKAFENGMSAVGLKQAIVF